MADTRAAAGKCHGIASRVTLVVISSAALGAFAAAAVAIATVDQLLSDQADFRLRGATVELAGELDEDEEGDVRESLNETLDDENSEIAASGIQLGVFDGTALVAGRAQSPAPKPGTCETRGVVGARVRACAQSHRSWVLVASQPSDEARLRWWYLLAASGALVLGAATGSLLSVKLTRWAVAPLQTLALSLRRSQPQGGNLAELGPPSHCEEVEAVREAVQSLMDQIQVLLDQARRFAADAAHELRTPLTTVRAELELLAEELSGPEREALDRACARAARLSELVDRLLVLALPEDTLFESFETVSLSDVVSDVVADLEAEESTRVRFETSTEGLVRGDAELLRSLVTNALRNALKFGAPDPVTVRVEDRVESSGMNKGYVVLEVLDGGPGIDAELRARVFDAFYRAQAAAAGGYGLGLSLVGHIARVHGGRAEFDESPKGARLCVWLPAWVPSQHHGAAE